MKKTLYLLLLCIFVSIYMTACGASDMGAPTDISYILPNPIFVEANGVEVTADPAIELMSIVAWLSPYYNERFGHLNTKLETQYVDDVRAQFSEFSEHEVIRVFEKLVKENNISYNDIPELVLPMTSDFQIMEDT